jgi:hypothetical protein
VYIADVYNHRIRRITPEGIVSTIAGTGTAGFAEGLLATAQLNSPAGVTVDGDLNLYVAATTYGLAETAHAAALHWWMDLIQLQDGELP